MFKSRQRKRKNIFIVQISRHIAFLKNFFRSYKDFTDAQIDTIEILLSKLYARFDITDSTDYNLLIFGVKWLMDTNRRLKDCMPFNILYYMSNELLGKGSTTASVPVQHRAGPARCAHGYYRVAVIIESNAAELIYKYKAEHNTDKNGIP